MCIDVLTVCMSVYHVCACCPGAQKRESDSLGLKFEPLFGCWELNSGPIGSSMCFLGIFFFSSFKSENSYSF